MARESLFFDFPGKEFVKSYRDGYWDGIVKHCDKNGRFPYGLLDIMLKVLHKRNIKFQIIEPDFFLPVDTNNLDSRLHLHQKEAVVEFFKNNFCGIQFPTRAGKTFFASECIRLVSQQYKDSLSCFVVDTEDLFKQAIEDIAKFLGIKESKIGRIKADVFDPKQITVASVQTIQSIYYAKPKVKDGELKEDYQRKIKNVRERRKLLNNYLSSLNFLICDEIHESFSTKERTSIIRYKCTNLNWLLSLSATTYKSGETEENMNDLKNIELRSVFGGIKYEVFENTMKERGILANERVLFIFMEHFLSPIEYHELQDTEEIGIKKYQHYEKKIILNNIQRDNVILTVLSCLRRANLKTLALLTSKVHGRRLERLSGDKFICGNDRPEEREYWKEWFLKGIGKILIASDIYKKGITLPDVNVIYNLDGGKEDSLLIQRRGRGLGVTKDKKKMLFIDMADQFDKFFSEHSFNRIKVLEERVGKENIDVLYVNDEDFYEQLQEYIKNWK